MYISSPWSNHSMRGGGSQRLRKRSATNEIQNLAQNGFCSDGNDRYGGNFWPLDSKRSHGTRAKNYKTIGLCWVSMNLMGNTIWRYFYLVIESQTWTPSFWPTKPSCCQDFSTSVKIGNRFEATNDQNKNELWIHSMADLAIHMVWHFESWT